MKVNPNGSVELPTLPCPKCGQDTWAVEANREPRETTYDAASWESTGFRTFEPGPFADVKLRCGCELYGVEGARFLDATA